MYKTIITLAMVLLIGLALSLTAIAQPTQFTYQGKLDDNGSPANGNFDFEFTIFDVVAGGSPIGSTITLTDIAVSDGIFSVVINSGTVFASGANRFLEIGVRPSGGGAYTTLNPRQPVTSAPYAIKSKASDTADTATNAAQLGGVAAAQYVVTTDPRLSDARPPTPGSDDYIRNGTTNQFAEFKIIRTGRAKIFSADDQFDLDGTRFIHKGSVFGTGNTFVGIRSGDSIESSAGNSSFFGYESGEATTTALGNSFFGSQAGKATTTGNSNAFFGYKAGTTNTVGVLNAFFGSNAGDMNLDGGSNSFFGYAAGRDNESGNFNSFIGATAGFLNTTGNDNTFVGWRSGETNTTGNSNTLLGRNTDVGAADLVFATAIGANAVVSASNTVQLGRANGNDNVVIPGLGSAGSTQLCRNASKQVSTCSSSLRYKSNIRSFDSGLVLIRKLRPVSFNWTDGGMPDLGLVAEDVAEVEPLLTTTKDGRVEGVKYDRVGVVIVNAVNEQQEQIEELREKVKRQKREIGDLKSIVCEMKPEATICVSIEN